MVLGLIYGSSNFCHKFYSMISVGLRFMDLVHELCPLQLLEVTKKRDTWAGWLASIQHLAHMSILFLYLTLSGLFFVLLANLWRARTLCLWLLKCTQFSILVGVRDMWHVVGRLGWCRRGADPVVTASALMVVWSCSVTRCHAVSRRGVMRS